MKALIGLAAAAVLALTAGGITAALPGTRTGHDPAEGTTTQVRVTAVVDGDTIRVETRDGRHLGRVRLLGIDAPEVAHPPEPAECYADQATDLLEELAPVGSTVELVTDTAQPTATATADSCATSTTTTSTWPASSWPAVPPAATKQTRRSSATSRTPRPPMMPRTLSAACGVPADSKGYRSRTSS